MFKWIKNGFRVIREFQGQMQDKSAVSMFVLANSFSTVLEEYLHSVFISLHIQKQSSAFLVSALNILRLYEF